MGEAGLMRTVRRPKLAEMTEVKRLLDAAARDGDLLARPIMELYETARDFVVCADEAGVAGCCALHIDLADLAEIRSLTVRHDLRGQGWGRRLLEACVEDARALEIARVYALTRAPAFFEKYGFAGVDKHELPHKVFQDCVKCPLFPDCDEVAMVRHLNGV